MILFLSLFGLLSLGTLDWGSPSCVQPSHLGDCQHDHLEYTHEKQWIERDSQSHKALVNVVLNMRWQKEGCPQVSALQEKFGDMTIK